MKYDIELSPSSGSGSNTLTPGVNYIASISSSIEDTNGNFLDYFGSKGVDDNCEWNFKAESSSTVPPAPSIAFLPKRASKQFLGL